MATAIDFKAEEKTLRRSLSYTIRERDKEALKVRKGEGDEAHLQRLREKIKWLEEQLEEIEGAIALDQEERLQQAEADRLHQRATDAREYQEVISGLKADATELAELEAKVSAVTGRITDRLSRGRELRGKWIIGEGEKRENKVWTLAERFSGKRVEVLLSALAARAGLIPAEVGMNELSIVDGLTRYADQMLRQSTTEFPELGES